MRPIIEKQNKNVKRNFLSSFGISLKKVVSSASLAVAPQVILISNMCDRRACEMWREMPPRKIRRSGTHLKFSQTETRNMLVDDIIYKDNEEV
jgi:hypothetical protein